MEKDNFYIDDFKNDYNKKKKEKEEQMIQKCYIALEDIKKDINEIGIKEYKIKIRGDDEYIICKEFFEERNFKVAWRPARPRNRKEYDQLIIISGWEDDDNNIENLNNKNNNEASSFLFGLLLGLILGLIMTITN